MEKKISSKEQKRLKSERTDLLAQSAEFLEEGAYELIPELFTQIADISHQLGEQDLADEFFARVQKIRRLLETPTTDPSKVPSVPSTVPVPAEFSTVAPKTEIPPPDSKEEPLTTKLQKLKSLANFISIPRLAPQPAIPAEPPIKRPQTTGIPPISIPRQETPPLNSSVSEIPSLSQRLTEKGAPLESGIVPTIVKDEKEVLYEILNEKLPLMPFEEKQKAVEEILRYPVGTSRDAWLKVILIKNKKYAIK